MQSNENSAEQGESSNQHQPTVPDEEDIWEGDSAVGGVRSYAYAHVLYLVMASEKQSYATP